MAETGDNCSYPAALREHFDWRRLCGHSSVRRNPHLRSRHAFRLADFVRSTTSWRSFLIVGYMKDRVVDIWPELLGSEGAEIQQNVGQPTLSNLGPGAVHGWVVERGDSSSCAGSHNL